MPTSAGTNISFSDLVPDGYRVRLGKGETVPSEKERKLNLFFHLEAEAIPETRQGSSRRLTGEEKNRAELKRKDALYSYFTGQKALLDDQKSMISDYQHRHRDLGRDRWNSRHDNLFYNLRRLAGSAADAENLRKIVDEDAPNSLRGLTSKPFTSKPSSRSKAKGLRDAPARETISLKRSMGGDSSPNRTEDPSTLFSYDGGSESSKRICGDKQRSVTMAGVCGECDETQRRYFLDKMPTNDMTQTFEKLLDDDDQLSVSERAKAEEYHERLTTFESPDLAKWTASCIKGQGSTQGRGDFVRICERLKNLGSIEDEDPEEPDDCDYP